MIDWLSLDPQKQVEVLQRPLMENDKDLLATVASILRLVRKSGDTALRQLTLRYDQVQLDNLAVDPEEIEQAIAELSSEVKRAIDDAYARIRTFHEAQLQPDIQVETAPGVNCQLRIRPLQAIGLYVPGGKTPLTSSALMQGVPAQIAGCPMVALTSPANSQGRMAPEIIYAASLCGINKLYKLGGAQAIAAMAYGTRSIPRVDKIFGPGNRYVTAAKQMVSQVALGVSIDMPAGPSEVMVIADGSANPEFVAADLLSQAEHGADSQVVLVSDDADLINAVELAVRDQISQLSRKNIAEQALQHARSILVGDMDMAIEVSNQYAPEHLILNMKNPEDYLERVLHAGSIFVGPWSPESAGDYASGTNHVLPTYGAARYTDSLTLKDFQKRSTIQTLTRAGLATLSTTILTLAESEGLDGHAQAVSLRLQEVMS